ncbi:hypothetical protein [Marinospirillum perlucidum]|uniref:hypothetical protein n=1 Tax=Marinospirillum perlucidum TaxID=1982602 RepID=UPI00139018A7|nr:hypothetical protein [Marinospirillum perlucidum]
MKMFLKRHSIFALSLIILPWEASADLFMPYLNAQSLGRVGAGTAHISGSSSILENPAGLTLNHSYGSVKSKSISSDISSSGFEISAGFIDRPDWGNSNANRSDLYSNEDGGGITGGMHYSALSWGIGVAVGDFGEFRTLGPDETEEGFAPLSGRYYGVGTAYNFLPDAWDVNFKVGLSYLHSGETGFALVGGVQSKIIDNSKISLMIGGSRRQFFLDDYVATYNDYADYVDTDIDLPHQSAVGIGLLVKNIKTSFNFSIDYKITDYTDVVFLDDPGPIKSWSPALANIGVYESMHSSITLLTYGGIDLTVGYNQGNDEAGVLESSTLGVSFYIQNLGIGYSTQEIEANEQAVSSDSLILTFQTEF